MLEFLPPLEYPTEEEELLQQYEQLAEDREWALCAIQDYRVELDMIAEERAAVVEKLEELGCTSMTSSYDDTPTVVECHSGALFDFLDPKPEQIRIDDIARSLAYTYRWRGQTTHHISVAQHSVLVSRHVRNNGFDYQIQMQALLHDAAEAYTGDVPKPVKQHLPDFQAMELLIERAIFDRFNVSHPMSPIVRIADSHVGRWEYRDLMPGTFYDDPIGNPPVMDVWHPGAAMHQFLFLFWELSEEIA